ncbi:hypothetical protein AAFF_G00177920 [Aldrovandia affinis]|uniref:V-SNARE coiled-coil homology domain-containing protein n=1 Tax=Aldrovandia affinis TaxID=143900 RepID=A0AAD7RNB2_9TELE|nr:hypothetical protein AAFF_G00177920 [Aldrovandia affinis]
MENGNSRLRQAQEDVDEVAVIMLENLQKAEDRSGKLGELETRADELLEKSKGFAKTTGKVKRQKRWESIRMKHAKAPRTARGRGEETGKEESRGKNRRLWLIPLGSGNMDNLTYRNMDNLTRGDTRNSFSKQLEPLSH